MSRYPSYRHLIVTAPSIASAAMLVELSLSVWTGKKKDKAASAEVTAANNADRGVALSEIFRVLRPGGTLVIGEELLEPDYARAVTIQRWAENAGFKLVRSEGWAIEYLLKFTRPLTQVDMAREAANQS